MSALRVGIDVLRVSEVAGAIARFGDRYLDRLFTAHERAYCLSRGDQAPAHLAARFAAKEAAFKVLRPPHRWLDPRSIEVRRQPAGFTELVLTGEARALADDAGIDELALSLSHEDDIATAVVVALRTQGG